MAKLTHLLNFYKGSLFPQLISPGFKNVSFGFVGIRRWGRHCSRRPLCFPDKAGIDLTGCTGIMHATQLFGAETQRPSSRRTLAGPQSQPSSISHYCLAVAASLSTPSVMNGPTLRAIQRKKHKNHSFDFKEERIWESAAPSSGEQCKLLVFALGATEDYKNFLTNYRVHKVCWKSVVLYQQRRTVIALQKKPWITDVVLPTDVQPQSDQWWIPAVRTRPYDPCI